MNAVLTQARYSGGAPWSVTVADNEEYWREMLTEGIAVLDKGRAVLSLIPSHSRCMFCHSPFEGLGVG